MAQRIIPHHAFIRAAGADVSAAQAYAVIDRIRQDFAKLPHPNQNGALYATFSAGVAAYPLYDTPQELTEAADNALLSAKRSGRNRVEMADAESCRAQF